MPDYCRLYQGAGTYFFTVVTHKRQRILQTDEAVNLLRRCFAETITSHPFAVEALVVLPDHLHTIWALPQDDCDFSTRWNRIKGDFSRRYQGAVNQVPSMSRRTKREKAIWQRRFWEHLVRNQDEFNALCDYIHYNPVRHGLAKSPADWKHGTFAGFLERGLCPKDWGQSAPDRLKELDLE